MPSSHTRQGDSYPHEIPAQGGCTGTSDAQAPQMHMHMHECMHTHKVFKKVSIFKKAFNLLILKTKIG